jgi:hypothetical protein
MKTKYRISINYVVLLTLFLIFTNSCKKDVTNTTNHSVGQSTQGAKIAYILQKGDPGYDSKKQHGLIAAPCHYSLKTWWFSGTFITTGTTDTAIGTGHANTISIVKILGIGNYPAKFCVDLELGGYHDWYLPSKNELNKIFQSRKVVGDFSTDNYWSSSEYNIGNVWVQNFNDGRIFYANKGDSARFCPVRSF